MDKAYKFRIYPNTEQRELLEKTFGCCRWVYNRTLALRQERHARGEKSKGINHYITQIPVWKKTDAPWLSEVDSMALQQSLRNLDRAYKNFFRKPGAVGFPKFKSKHGSRASYRTNRVVVVDGKHVKLPKVGVVKARVSRPVEGRVLSATVKRTPSGKYFVTVCCADVPSPTLPEGTVGVLGIDAGVRNVATCSTGERLVNPRSLAKNEKRLARAQRKLARKQRGSANRAKQRLRVARIHEKIANQRADALHKFTTHAVRESQAIAVEDLDVRTMLEERSRGRAADGRVHAAVADASMGELLRQLEYKCEWYGRGFAKIDPAGTSETCSECGNVQDMPLWRRTYRCQNCGLEVDRDLNAARNIAREGKRILEGTVGHTGAASSELANACGAGIRPVLS